MYRYLVSAVFLLFGHFYIGTAIGTENNPILFVSDDAANGAIGFGNRSDQNSSNGQSRGSDLLIAVQDFTIVSTGSWDYDWQFGFEAHVLRRAGYRSHLLWLERIHYSDHAVCYWPESDGFYFMEHAHGGFEGIYGPFDSVQDIGAKIFTHLLAGDGLSDDYILFNMNSVPYRVDWVAFHDAIVEIPGGDTNGDIDIDGSDLAVFSGAYANQSPGADLTGEDDVNTDNLQLFAERFAQSHLPQ